jgi:hypothetical protein
MASKMIPMTGTEQHTAVVTLTQQGVISPPLHNCGHAWDGSRGTIEDKHKHEQAHV